jgi:hypothetical protein
MKGNGWTCTANSCWRSDSLAGGAVYDPISVETAVQSNAPSVAMNQISVAGGGSDGASVTQFLSIAPFTCDISGDGAIDVVDVQTLADEVFGLIPAVHDLNHDGVVGVADVQKLINAALGMGCPYQ